MGHLSISTVNVEIFLSVVPGTTTTLGDDMDAPVSVVVGVDALGSIVDDVTINFMITEGETIAKENPNSVAAYCCGF